MAGVKCHRVDSGRLLKMKAQERLPARRHQLLRKGSRAPQVDSKQLLEAESPLLWQENDASNVSN